MPEPWYARYREGRLRAAFFWFIVSVLPLALAGCSANPSAQLNTVLDLLPGGNDASRLAAELPYASIDFHIAGRGGLLVLAEQPGDVTYFQSAGREVIALERGYLDHTAGLPANLLMTRFLGADGPLDARPWRIAEAGEPLTYVVQRQWQGAGSIPHTDAARATLTCETQATPTELPLTTLSLQRCRETLVWSGGAETYSTLWRSPEDHRLWAVTTVPWPGAPEIEWRVARPWW